VDLTIFFGALACSYILGSLPFGLWVGLIWKGVDIRTLGSKNIGATNVLRILGPGPGITVFLLDTLKGAAFIWIYGMMADNPQFGLKAIIGVTAILGHTFSAFLNFKGGKGVATTLGVLIGLNPIVAAWGFGTWLVVVLITRYVSLASLCAGICLPIAFYFNSNNFNEKMWTVPIFILIAIFVFVKHTANIKRLLAGTEPKFGKKKEESEEGQQ
jgi:glycerol-3-phosphate acyltransferase PlsY